MLNFSPPCPWPTIMWRHAQTERNVEAIPRDAKYTTKVELTDIGQAQRRHMAHVLRQYVKSQGWENILVFLSPFDRAQVTAEPTIAALRNDGLTVNTITCDLLREHNTGLYGTDSVIDDERWQKMRNLANKADAYHYFIPPGGRALADTAADQLLFHNTMLEGLRNGQWGKVDAVFISCHGIQGRLLLKARLGLDWKWYWENGNLYHASPYHLGDGETAPGYLFHPDPQTR